MRILKMLAVVAILFAVSCKKDKGEEAMEALVGHWHISSFEPDSSSDMALMAKEVIDQLVIANCFPLEYSFTSDGKVSHIDKMSYLTPIQGDNGVEVDCFFDDIFIDGTFNINNNVLTLNYENETDVVTTSVSANTLVIIKGDFILMDEKISGKLTFSREVF